MQFVKLILQETKAGTVSVTVQDATAAHFGWDKAFPEWSARYEDGYTGGRVTKQAGRHHWAYAPGGDRLRICRDKKTTGYPAGKTHCFRMKGPWSRKHLVMLAEVADEKFEWMEGQFGQRICREDWISLAKRKRETPTTYDRGRNGWGR